MDILDDMGVSKLSEKVFWKVNYSFKSVQNTPFTLSIVHFRWSDHVDIE